MRNTSSILTLWCMLLSGYLSGHPNYHFDYDQSLLSAYTLSLRLKTDDAQSVIDSLLLSDPDNLAVLHIESYIDFFKVFIGEEEEELEKYRERHDRRMSLMSDAVLADDSPYMRFAQAEMTLQYALARAKFGEHIRAGWDINRAYKLLKKNRKEYPDFALNAKSMSIIHSLIGSLQGVQKSLVLLFTALEGDQEQGLTEIEALYVDGDDFFGLEIAAIYALLTQHVAKEPAQAALILREDRWVEYSSPLVDFLRGSMLLQTDQKDLGKRSIEKALSREMQQPFLYLEHLYGTLLLQEGNERALEHLMRFHQEYQGQHYIKENHQKIAWYHLLLNDDDKAYRSWMSRSLDVGRTELGEDQQAHQEAKSGVLPNKELLRIRLLSDRGWYDEAQDQLSKINLSELSADETLEYWYRSARVAQGRSHAELALSYFAKTIAIGIDDEHYFACNAALQSGVIYHHLGEKDKAIRSFEKCLDIDPSEHRRGLHQKAKSWLDKIK